MLGRSGKASRTQVAVLLEQEKNVVQLKYLQRQAARLSGELVDLTATWTSHALSTATAKVLSLSFPRRQEPWWNGTFFPQDVAELNAFRLQQWHTEGLLTRPKSKTHLDRLPLGSRPNYLLSAQCRDKLFGRYSELARWHSATVDLHNLVQSLRAESAVEVLESEASGSNLLAWLPFIADGTLQLQQVWNGAEDLYSAGLESPVFGGKNPQKTAAEPRCTRFTAATIPVVRRVSKKQKSTIVTPCATVLPKHASSVDWLLLSEDDVKPFLTSNAFESVDPGLLLKAQSEQEENKDQTPHESRKRRDKDTAAEPVLPSKKAFTRHFEELHKGKRDWSVDAMFDMAAFILRTLLLDAGASTSAKKQGAGSCRYKALDVQPLLRMTTCRNARGIVVSVLYKQCEDEVEHLRLSSMPRAVLIELIGASIACLEELRLIVPVPYGDEFVEVLSPFAAPFTVRRLPDSAGAGDYPSFCQLPSMAQALDLFGPLHPTRHWACDPFPARPLQEAAMAVLEEAGIEQLSDAMLRSLSLPRGAVATAVWVDGEGHFNDLLMRFLCIHLLRLMDKSCGLTAADVAKHAGVLDECEAAAIFSGLIHTGLCRQERCQHSQRVLVHSQALHRLRQTFENKEATRLHAQPWHFSSKPRPPPRPLALRGCPAQELSVRRGRLSRMQKPGRKIPLKVTPLRRMSQKQRPSSAR